MKIFKIEYIDQHQSITFLSDNQIYSSKDSLEYETTLEKDVKSRLKKDILGPVDIDIMEIGEEELQFFDTVFSNMNEKMLDLYSQKVYTFFGDKVDIIEYGKRNSIFMTMNVIFGIILFPQYENIITTVGITLLFFPLLLQKTMKTYKDKINMLFYYLDFKMDLNEKELVNFAKDWEYYKKRNRDLGRAVIELQEKRR